MMLLFAKYAICCWHDPIQVYGVYRHLTKTTREYKQLAEQFNRNYEQPSKYPAVIECFAHLAVFPCDGARWPAGVFIRPGSRVTPTALKSHKFSNSSSSVTPRGSARAGIHALLLECT